MIQGYSELFQDIGFNGHPGCFKTMLNNRSRSLQGGNCVIFEKNLKAQVKAGANFKTTGYHFVLFLVFLTGLILSGIYPHDYFTWALEVFPGVLGVLFLVITFKQFRFSDLTYFMILVHCLILFIGGHYTYAEVPVFEWIKEVFHQSRNNYDKVGHFAQGFVPAFIVRELLMRKDVVQPGGWLSFLTVCVCLSISVFYEFLEWAVAILSGQSAEAFLGTQGYVWDTQSDMLYACAGAITMVVLFSGMQNRQVKKQAEQVPY